MQAIEYICPRRLEDALQQMHLHAGKIKPYAGGTDLMVQLRERAAKLSQTQWLLDLQYLPQLHEVTQTQTTITIGAMETHDTIAHCPIICQDAPILAKAASQVGSPQVRNRGTIGGNVANASAAADTISPLAALNAVVNIASVQGTRSAPLQQLYTKNGRCALGDEELILSLTFDRLSGWRMAFTKLGRRKALAISRLNTAVALLEEDGKIADCRIAPGCVFAAPDRVKTAEAILIGEKPSQALFDRAAAEVAEEMIRRTGVRWSTAYKRPALEAVVAQTLAEAWECDK